MIYCCRRPRWGPVRSACLVPWSRCSRSLFHVSWRVSLVSPSNLCPAEICSQPAWQVGRLLIFVSVKICRSVTICPARENGVFVFLFNLGNYFFYSTPDRGIIMTFGSGSNGCLGHGNFNDVTQVDVTLFTGHSVLEKNLWFLVVLLYFNQSFIRI